MTPQERAEYIRRMVDGWPPVTAEQYARLALLLAPVPQSVAALPQRRITDTAEAA
ncbi:hypothetical protein ACFWPV_10235 [Streptomyces uncialis]|uniref:hypothetical protein n=1 Tax=Streptomyces uncialis TaxID=1048205 RepID=UPI0036573E2B